MKRVTSGRNQCLSKSISTAECASSEALSFLTGAPEFSPLLQSPRLSRGVIKLIWVMSLRWKSEPPWRGVKERHHSLSEQVCEDWPRRRSWHFEFIKSVGITNILEPSVMMSQLQAQSHLILGVSGWDGWDRQAHLVKGALTRRAGRRKWGWVGVGPQGDLAHGVHV